MPISLTQRLAKTALSGRFLGAAGLLDLGLGVALMRDNRIPARYKAAAMAAGGAAITAMIALELPVEGISALALPFLGAGLDLAADGAQEVVGTLLLASLLLPRIAPRVLVDEIRGERK